MGFSHYRHSLKIALFAGSALALAGCFQNMSGTSGVVKKTSSQSNFSDTTPSSGSFDGTILRATASLVNTYAGVDANGVSNSTFGMVINLQKSFENAIGASTLADVLSRSDQSSVLAMPVELSINEFKIKAKFQFGKVVLSKQLQNVMVIRPAMGGVDFAAGYLPDTAPVVMTSTRYVYTYGGIEGGDAAIARMTMFFRNTNPYGTGFLPNVTNQSWGQNFPSEADATSNAEFMRLTPELGKLFGGICSDPNNNTFICDTSFSGAQSAPENYLLAVHTTRITPAQYNAFAGLDIVNEKPKYDPYPSAAAAQYYYKVMKAWVIFPTATGPKGLELCNSNFNLQTSSIQITNAAGANVTYSVSDKRACDCANQDLNFLYNDDNATNGLVIPVADRQKLYDYCISNAVTTTTSPIGGSTNKGVENKRKWLVKAVTEKPIAPASGIITPPSGALNDVTFISIP